MLDSIVFTGNRDFGDLPDGYPVTDLENGARHIPAGPRLGDNVDVENGVDNYSAAADWDDSHINEVLQLALPMPDDENGVKAVGVSGSPMALGALA